MHRERLMNELTCIHTSRAALLECLKKRARFNGHVHTRAESLRGFIREPPHAAGYINL